MTDRRAYAKDIVPELGLQRSTHHFWCPYCQRTWERGGHKEGFVKSSATNHVALCWEILLYVNGFAIGGWGDYGRLAVTLEEIRKQPYAKRWERALKAGMRSRTKLGCTPRMPAK